MVSDFILTVFILRLHGIHGCWNTRGYVEDGGCNRASINFFSDLLPHFACFSDVKGDVAGCRWMHEGLQLNFMYDKDKPGHDMRNRLLFPAIAILICAFIFAIFKHQQSLKVPREPYVAAAAAVTQPSMINQISMGNAELLWKIMEPQKIYSINFTALDGLQFEVQITKDAEKVNYYIENPHKNISINGKNFSEICVINLRNF